MDKTVRIIKKLETQIRTTSRQLVQFDSEEDTLQYIANTFREKLTADFVGFILKKDNLLNIKAWSGQKIALTDEFPMSVERCSPKLFLNSKTCEQFNDHECVVKNFLNKEKIPTWFTFPLTNELNLFGFCIIGYFHKVTLYNELDTIFDEFGKDVAIAMLYQREKQHKQRLQQLLTYQQALIKETLDGNMMDGITKTLKNILSNSVVLLDRFLRPISYELVYDDENLLNELVELATFEIVQNQSSKIWYMTESPSHKKIAVWPINVGRDLLGYIVLDMEGIKIDDYFLLSIDVARNIYSIQFMKQKLVLDTKEQMKDSFINKLLTENISDYETIYQYANLFNWDINLPHFVAVISITFPTDYTANLFEVESLKSLLWEQVKSNITLYYPELLITTKDGEFILIAPAKQKNTKEFFSKLFEDLKKWIAKEKEAQIFLAIGEKTVKITDYYVSYLQALKTLTVMKTQSTNSSFAFFNDLGSYTLLQQIQPQMVSVFIKKHLEPLLHYEGKNMDLIHTLDVYLNHNGNIKETSEALYIHRSTLLYRLEKIENLLNINLNDSNHRFNLMMAIKLYHLFHNELKN